MKSVANFFRTTIVMMLCFLITALVIDFVSGMVFRSGLLKAKLGKTWGDYIVLQNRWIASFRLSDKEIKLLKYPPISKYNMTVLYSDPILKINGLFSKEFYVGDKIFLVDNPDSAPFYKNRVKELHAQFYPDTDQFVAGLKEHLQGRKLIVTFGGSTTAWSHNWPYFVAKNLEKKYPGQFLVLNAGEPGHITWEHGFVLESILNPLFKQENIKPSLFLFMDGTNDTLLGTYWHLAYKIAEKMALCEASTGDYLDPGKIYFPLYKQNETEAERVVQGLEKIAFKVMPYTSLIMWRLTPALSAPSPSKTVIKYAENNCSSKAPILNGVFINEHIPVIKEQVATKNGKYPLPTVETNEIDSNAILQFFRKGIDFSIANSGDTPFYFFLQPEATDSFYSLIPKRTEMAKKINVKPWSPSVDYCLQGAGLTGLQIPDVFFDIDKQYIKNVSLFEELNQQYPNRFISIADLFKSITDIADDPYSPDAIHYGVKASEKIGNKIFALLDDQQVFSKLEENG